MNRAVAETGLVRASALVAQHGWNATAPQVLASGYHYWYRGDGCVAYADTGGAWVAAGAPIAADADLVTVADGFVAAARAAGRRAVFFGTEPRFAGRFRGRHLPIALQPEWDPTAWPATLRAHRRLREQVRRARAKRVRVRVVTSAELSADAALRAAIADTRDAWLRTRRMAPMGFLVELAPPGTDDRLWLCAERDGELVAAAAVASIPARAGTLVEHVVRRPSAPNGTTEAIVDAAMTLAAGRGDAWLTLGMAPLAGEVAWPLRAARWLGRPLYNFAGLHATRARLHPARWTPIYLSVPPGASVVRATVDVLAAFAHGSFLRYGVANLRHWLRR